MELKKTMTTLKLKLIALMVLVCLSTTQCTAEDQLIVNTTKGLVKGISEYVQGTKVDKFLGVPYAAPPVQDLRFRDPVPHAPWKDTRDTTKYPPLCAMVGLDEQVKMSEDCLYLNVFVPEVFRDVFDGLPVVVLLGSLPLEYRSSGTSLTENMMLDGAVLAVIEGVIVVTVSYRRDVFGFLATEDPDSAGNYALKDQVMALQWVVDNIGQFRGNNKLITLGGLVDGGAYVAMHMVSPISKGLFQKAFMTGYVSPYSDAVRKHYPGGGPAETFTKELAERVDCANNDEDVISCLRKLSTENITTESVNLYEEKYKNRTGGYWMFMDRVDGSFLPDDVTSLWEAGSYGDIPLMVGGEPVPTDSDFGNLEGVSEEEFTGHIHRLVSSMPWETPSQENSYFQPLVEAAMFVYNNWTNGGQKRAQQIKKMEADQKQAGQVKMTSVFTDYLNNNTDKKPTAYKYIFNYKSTNSPRPGLQVGDDVLYILGVPLKSNKWSFKDQQTSRVMMAFYGNFIYHGDPTHSSGISWWPMFDSTDQKYLEVNREGSTDIKQHYRKDKVSFWNRLRPMMLSGLEDIVLDVKRNPVKYDAYVTVPDDTDVEQVEQVTGNKDGGDDKNENEIKEDDDNDINKYFLATWILAGVGILLALGIVVLLVITYRAKAEAYTFEGTKL